MNQAFHDHFLEEELASFFSIRGYKIDSKRRADTGTIPGHYRPSSKEKISNQVIFLLIFSKTTLSLTFEIPFLLGYNGRNKFLRGTE